MALNQPNNRAYGLDNALQKLAPRPIVSQRAPLTTDKMEIGTTWIDVPNQAVYILVAISANSAVWTTSPASGVGAFTAVTINPGNLVVTAGDATVTAGDLTVTAGNTILGGDLTVAGTTTFNGDIDFASAALIDFVSTLDAAPSILLHANGGTSEQIQLHSDLGTSLTSIYLLSDVGGIKLYAPGLANDAAIALQADTGGLDVDVAMQLSLVSTENTADSIEISSTNGGIDITSGGAAGEDIDISASSSVNITSTEDASESIYLHANGGVTSDMTLRNTLGTAADSINIESLVGGITLTAAAMASNDSINIVSTLGGIDIDAGMVINIASSANGASAIVLDASAGGLDILASGAAAGEDINITATGSSINIESTEAVASAIVLNASDAAGGMTLDAGSNGIVATSTLGPISLISTEDASESIYLHSNGGVTSDITIRNTLGTAVDSINIESLVGGITLTSGLASADAFNVAATAGGIDMDAALAINIASSANGASAIVLDSSAGGLDILASGAAAGEDINITATGSSINLEATEAAANAITLNASDAAGGITLDAGTNGIVATSTLGPISLVSTEDAADALYLHANGGTSETIRLHSDLGTGSGSITLLSDAGGITTTATAGAVTVTSGSDAADSIYLHANAGTSEKIRVHSDLGTGQDSVQLESDAGGITLTSPAAFGVLIDNGTQTAGLYVGTGSPDTALTAVQGSLYMRVDGSSTSTRLYVNTDGATAWTNFTSAA